MNISHGVECNFSSPLKVGLIENDFIDYKYYLYYTLGEYSLRENVDFDLNMVDNNIDEFDIIFGEYQDLDRLSKYNIDLPNNIRNFYKNNHFELKGNLLPLDLDTFILVSKENNSVKDLEELSKYFDSTRYSLGMTFVLEEFSKLLTSLNNDEIINFNNLLAEPSISLLKQSYRNTNKSIIYENFEGVYESFNNFENTFTQFSDGIILYKNIEFKNFQIFPQSKYIWNKNLGFYTDNIQNPISFYGFSAYLNNSNQNGFLCFLLEESSRLIAFEKFNLQISPFSSQEIEPIKDKVPQKYIDILNKKNNFVFNKKKSLNYDIEKKIIDFIVNQSSFEKLSELSEYLN